MKRWAIGSIAFFLTFGIGTAVSMLLLFNYPLVETIVERTEPREVIIAEAVNPNEFVPEFKDLANIEEFLFDSSTAKLIDVHNVDDVYRRSEVIAKTGEVWLAFVRRNDQYFLTPARAKVRKLRSSSYPGDELDAQLSFQTKGSPIFVTKAIPTLKPGPVTTLYLHPTPDAQERTGEYVEPMKPGYRQTFQLGARTYTLRVSNGLTKDDDKVAVLVLEQGNRSQIVAYNYDIIGNLLWAGDLDNDGKLDFYLDEFNEKGYFESQLYLSSASNNTGLTKLVATFGMLGC